CGNDSRLHGTLLLRLWRQVGGSTELNTVLSISTGAVFPAGRTALIDEWTRREKNGIKTE
ncbi:hypothetical protein, partial [uncultured Akkermansia sp.]|uniref:hypothetical protein n=1 Tax=uncultured Akkermansia sp. TaxID=512294 RepID=UPI002597694C